MGSFFSILFGSQCGPLLEWAWGEWLSVPFAHLDLKCSHKFGKVFKPMMRRVMVSVGGGLRGSHFLVVGR